MEPDDGDIGMNFKPILHGDARNRDWVETKTKGYTNLRPAWRDVLRRADKASDGFQLGISRRSRP